MKLLFLILFLPSIAIAVEPTSIIVVELDRVVDGDSVNFRVCEEVKARLSGIDAPEPNDKDPKQREKGLRAKLHVVEAMQSPRVLLQMDKNKDGSDKRDNFGRALGIVWYEREGKQVNLNQELVEAGLAVPYREGK